MVDAAVEDTMTLSELRSALAALRDVETDMSRMPEVRDRAGDATDDFPERTARPVSSEAAQAETPEPATPRPETEVARLKGAGS